MIKPRSLWDRIFGEDEVRLQIAQSRVLTSQLRGWHASWIDIRDTLSSGTDDRAKCAADTLTIALDAFEREFLR